MGKKSIKKNYLYNLSYQLLVVIMPLITTPYLSRVLGADGIGTYSYAESIVAFFTLFATFGITTFGQREISYVQDCKEKRSLVFWETKSLEMITAGIVLISYIIFCFFQIYPIIYVVLVFEILSVFVDITWFYQGLEEFSKIVARNFVIKIINVVYIFCVVKSKNDLTLYVFGKAFFEFLGNASLWSYLPKYVEKPDFKCIKPLRNIKLVSALFIPTIAIKIYTVLDKTMIGVITNDSFENGYYEQAIKISKITLSVVTSLGNVMIPRIGFYHGRNETEKVKNFMYKSYRFVWIMGIPLCFGLIGISSNFVPWFFGYGYEKVIFLIRVLAFLILAIGVNNVTGGQYLIPTKRENIYTLTVIIGAVVNFGLNLCLIQFFKSIGAAVASVIAESVIAVTQLFIVRKELSVKKIIKSSWHYWIAGLIMLILLMYMSAVLSPTIVHTIFMVICGAITYGVFLCIMKDEFLINNLKDMYIRFSGKWNVR